PRRPPQRPFARSPPAFLTFCWRTKISAADSLPAGSVLSVPVAIPTNGTFVAPRIPGFAQRTAMRDDREMPRLPFLRWSPSLEGGSDRFVIAPAAQVPTSCDSSGRTGNRERRVASRAAQEDVPGLEADAREPHKLAA